MANVTITFGPHPMNPDGPTIEQSVDENKMLKVMVQKVGVTTKRAGDIAPPDMICYAGTCFPVQ